MNKNISHTQTLDINPSLIQVYTDFLNSLITDPKFMYLLLQRGNRKLYLPEKTSPCMRNEYFGQVFFRQVFQIREDEIQIGHATENVTCSELIEEIEKYLSLNNLPRLGVCPLYPANKQWLENVLYTWDCNHRLFRQHDLQLAKIGQE